VSTQEQLQELREAITEKIVCDRELVAAQTEALNANRAFLAALIALRGLDSGRIVVADTKGNNWLVDYSTGEDRETTYTIQPITIV
jgi:hypothetical protein